MQVRRQEGMLQDHIEATVRDATFIGAFHSTTGTNLAKIIIDGELRASPIRNSHLYFFYGKPSYTLKARGSVINEVSFACNERCVADFICAAPFDTGGVDSGEVCRIFP